MAAGDPTGEDLCVGTTDGDTLPDYSTWEEREITFDAPYSIVAGTKYAIVVRCLSADATNSLGWSCARPGEYANGMGLLSSDSGSTWRDPTFGTHDDDFWFITKSGVTEKDSYNGVHALTYGVGLTIWRAQTFIAASSYSITSVVLRLSQTVGKDPGTVTASIRNVEGEEDLPEKATTPSPSDAATDVTLDQATVSWTAGDGALSHNVYYGTESGNLSLISEEQAGTSFTITGITDGSPFEYVITRYWRIDEVNDDGTTTGDEWSFTTIRLDPPSIIIWYSDGPFYYRLLPDENGDYGSPPPDGVEDIDYEVLDGYLPNFINTNRRLVAATKNSIFYEDI